MRRNAERDKKSRALLLRIVCCTWPPLVILKVCGSIRMSWAVVLAGIIWAPLAAVAVVLIIGRASARLSEYMRRRKVARTLWESMEGLTLNNIGPIYGVRRQQGEKNRSYKRRILKAARTLDTVNVQNAPKPATGQKLDEIAKKYGIRRYPHETDEKLQSRIREAVLKNLEGGQKNGRL